MLKIDTHCHLGGSISPAFVWQVIQEQNLKYLAESYDDVVSSMTFGPLEKRDFHKFLDKFKIIDCIKWNENLIEMSIRDICHNLELNNIDYCWMDFSINKYLDSGMKWHKHEAIQFIYDIFQKYRPNKVGLILSLKYESMRASQRQYSKLIEHDAAQKCLIGLDLVGDEGYFDSDFYASIFRDWNSAGKITRAHVGESQSENNIKEAIDKLHVTNIAHGFKIINDINIVKLAKENNITFDLAITSNNVTGVWPFHISHPGIKMLDMGLRCTLGSDDPIQCSTTLDNEFRVAKLIGFSDDQLNRMRQIAYENTVKILNNY